MNLLLASGYQHERYSNQYILRNVHFSNLFYDFMAWRLANRRNNGTSGQTGKKKRLHSVAS